MLPDLRERGVIFGKIAAALDLIADHDHRRFACLFRDLPRRKVMQRLVGRWSNLATRAQATNMLIQRGSLFVALPLARWMRGDADRPYTQSS